MAEFCSTINRYKPETIAKAGRLLMAAFPGTKPDFVELLIMRASSNGMGEEEFIDAILNAIDTHSYPTITIADILNRKKSQLYTYEEMLKLVNDYGSKIWNDYDTVKIGNKTFWVKKTGQI